MSINNKLKILVKEELQKTLESTVKYKPNDEFKYMGTTHVVVSDNGFVVTAKTKPSNGKSSLVKLNHSQIKKQLSEEFIKAKDHKDGRTVIRGIETLLTNFPELQPLVDNFLESHESNSVGDLSVDAVYELNKEMTHMLSKAKPAPSTQKSTYNPYDSPSGAPSKGYMGSNYTGD